MPSAAGTDMAYLRWYSSMSCQKAFALNCYLKLIAMISFSRTCVHWIPSECRQRYFNYARIGYSCPLWCRREVPGLASNSTVVGIDSFLEMYYLLSLELRIPFASLCPWVFSILGLKSIEPAPQCFRSFRHNVNYYENMGIWDWCMNVNIGICEKC